MSGSDSVFWINTGLANVNFKGDRHVLFLFLLSIFSLFSFCNRATNRPTLVLPSL